MLVTPTLRFIPIVVPSKVQFGYQVQFLQEIQRPVDRGEAQPRDFVPRKIVDLIGAEMSFVFPYDLQDRSPLHSDPVAPLSKQLADLALSRLLDSSVGHRYPPELSRSESGPSPGAVRPDGKPESSRTDKMSLHQSVVNSLLHFVVSRRGLDARGLPTLVY
jgi:hypothetical protein